MTRQNDLGTQTGVVIGTETSREDRVAELNERYALAEIGSYKRDTLVVEFSADGDVVGLREFAAFKRHLYQEPDVEVPGSDGSKRVPIADYWLRHEDARKYDALVFAPPGSAITVGKREYNTWRGLAVTPEPADWSLNRYHIRDVICGGNEQYERWMHNWIAALVQRPGEHGWVAPVLKGGQGIGKGYFAHHQLGGMFRDANYAHLTSPGHLTGDFNSHLENRVYVFADEVVWGDRKVADRLKGLITESDIMINKKHVPQEIQKSSLHIVIASNAEKPMPVERDDRRLFVLQVAEIHKQDQEYFEALLEELNNGGRASMLDYFLSYEVDWNLLRTPPDTDAKREMKVASLSAEDEWWLDVLTTADEESWAGWETKIGRAFVVSRYSAWFDTFQPRSSKKTVTGLGNYFARHFKAGGMPSWPHDGGKVPRHDGENKRDNSWVFPSLAECRVAFDSATGTRNTWPDDNNDSATATAKAA